MLEYQLFLDKLSSLAKSYDDDTETCMEILHHFEHFFDSILRLENEYMVKKYSILKMNELDDEILNITNKLSAMEEEKGEVLYVISIKYPLFYTQFEFSIPYTIIEKYANILYTIRYIYENNYSEAKLYNEMGKCAFDIMYMLTNEFFVKQDTKVIQEIAIEDLMMEMIL